MTTCSIARRVDTKARFTALLLATTLTSTFLAPAAFAQEQPQAENVAAARALGLQGIKLADAGDCPGAIEKLSRAEALYHAPSILGRLGECQVNVGQVVVGTENLNRVVREELPANAPKAFRDAQTRAKGALAAALPKIARLTVKVDPPDAKPNVTVAGAPIPAALLGAERPTDPGTHEVVVIAPGYLTQTTTVTLAEGGSQELDLKLQKDPNAVAAAPPPPPPPVVVAAAPAPLTDAPPKKSHTLAYVALGVGGAGLLVGGVTGFLALGKKSDLDGCQDKKCPTSQEDTLDSAKSMATISTVGFAVGFVGVGAGIVLLLTGGSDNANASFARPRVAERGVVVHPFFGGTSAGVHGTF
jgi:hypothetical protein